MPVIPGFSDSIENGGIYSFGGNVTKIQADEEEHLLREQITQLPLLSLEQIAEGYNCSVEEIPDQWNTKVEEIKAYIKENSVSYDIWQGKEAIEPIFQLWNSTRGLPEKHPLFSFSKKFDSFDTFCKSYLSSEDAKFKASFIYNMKFFVLGFAKPGQIRNLDMSGENNDRKKLLQHGEYTNAREWVVVDAKAYRFSNDKIVTTKKVLEEVRDFPQSIQRDNLLFHATGSVALRGIASEKAILAGAEAKERGLEIETGEHVTSIRHNGSSLGGENRGLSDVYTKRNGIAKGYSVLRWFDEYEVAFGADVEKVNGRHKRETGEDGHYQVRDFSGEGTTVGRKLELDDVNFVLVDNERLPQIREWLEKNNLRNIMPVSFEAWELMREVEESKLLDAMNKPSILVEDNVSRARNAIFESCKTDVDKSIDKLLVELKDKIPTIEEMQKFKPQKEWFLRSASAEGIHGISHETRVLVLQELISQLLAVREGVIVDNDALRWASATHDTQRRHDEQDYSHGRESADWLDTKDLVPVEIKDKIKYLNQWHAVPDFNIPEMTTELAIFKDADALDRARLGDLDPRFLRLGVSQELVLIARKLFERSSRIIHTNRGVSQFDAVMAVAVEMGLVKSDAN